MYQHIKVPEAGQKIKVNADYSLTRCPTSPSSLYRGRRHR